jgi:hypothetical protein
VQAYELRPDELQILREACHEADLVERIQAELDAGAPLISVGSMKQEVPSPLVSEIRLHRTCLSSLLRP